ncbi:hypothetical protein CC79DRAFT_1328134 [Sarocladium strictum]
MSEIERVRIAKGVSAIRISPSPGKGDDEEISDLWCRKHANPFEAVPANRRQPPETQAIERMQAVSMD